MSALQATPTSVNLVRTGPRGRAPVILVHPVGLDLTYWGAQIEALGEDHDVVAFDLPGHGASPGSPADWTLDQATEVLAQVVRSTGEGGAHLVGLSVGGMISQAGAGAARLGPLAHPDRHGRGVRRRGPGGHSRFARRHLLPGLAWSRCRATASHTNWETGALLLRFRGGSVTCN